MSNKKIFLKHKERFVLSDVLPYEIPPIFNNQNFYRFLVENKIEIKDDMLCWEREQNDDCLDKIIQIIFGVKGKPEAGVDQNGRVKMSAKLEKLVSIPFTYRIRHKESDFRELAVCHPKNQLALIDFWDKYKEAIIYFCKKSNFSMRYPVKVSKYVYFNDKLHQDNLSDDESSIEECAKEYNVLKSFFVYEKFSNVYKFYESYWHHRCERKFNQMVRLDIAKCFDSIYTHSIAWAIYGKEIVKKDIKGAQTTFSGKFDSVMQNLNYNETNGIVIGPEFSRIFAELILQEVDFALERCLKDKYNLIHRQDYEVFRYVDDFFVFFNDATHKDLIISNLQVILREYKLSLNINKSMLFSRPIISDLSIAKNKISKLLDVSFDVFLDYLESRIGRVSPNRKALIFVRSKLLFIEYKTIIKECRVEYQDVLGYTLEIIDKKCKVISKKFLLMLEEAQGEKEILMALIDVLEFSFFIYSAAPKVNVTVKLCRIICRVVPLYKNNNKNIDFLHVIFKCIYDNIFFHLKKNRSDRLSQVETLYLLIALSELGEDYRVNEKLLVSYFDIEKDDNGNLIGPYTMNYFSLMVLLFYMKKSDRYPFLKDYVGKSIVNRIKVSANSGGDKFLNDTESLLLVLDSLSCPYIKKETKKCILKRIGISKQDEEKILSAFFMKSKRKKEWFIKWHDFDFLSSLDAKKSCEVY